MKTRFNEFLEITDFELTKEETRQLEEYHYLEVDGFCFIYNDNEMAVYKLFDEYESVRFNCDNEVDEI